MQLDARERATDALRVARRAYAAGQHSAARRFVEQSMKLCPTEEAQVLLDLLQMAANASMRQSAAPPEEETLQNETVDRDVEDDDGPEYEQPRHSASRMHAGYSRTAADEIDDDDDDDDERVELLLS